MNIYSEIETLNNIIKNKKSIVRFGDGEFYHLFTNKNKYSAGRQNCDIIIQKKLHDIFTSNDDNILIGISGFLASNEHISKNYKLFTPYMKKFIKNIKTKLDLKYSDYMNKKYYSAEITRLKNLVEFKEIISIFDNLFLTNDVVFVGNKNVINIIENNFKDKFRKIDYVEIPKQNAFSKYDEIMEKCKKFGHNKLFLLSIGITATIIGYELAKYEYWALDIGHYFEQLNKL